MPYRWPTTLRLPERPPVIVYLDTNHWISLAKVPSGHPDGARFDNVYKWSLAAVADGVATFPISDATFHEVTDILRHRQQRHLLEVIEALSGFTVLTSRPDVSTHEIETVLDELVGRNPSPIRAHDLLQWGVMRAFGLDGRLQVFDEHGNEITEQARREHPGGPAAFDRMVREAELQLQRRVLAGPTPDEEAEMRELGWRPESTRARQQRRLDQEVEYSVFLDSEPSLRRGRLRDAVSVREVLIEVNEVLARGMAERGAQLDDFTSDLESNRSVFDSMPSFDVAVTLKTALHRNPQHRWTTNDIHDIDALGSAVPYCDVVLTDAAMVTRIRQEGLDTRLRTIASSNLLELPNLVGQALAPER